MDVEAVWLPRCLSGKNLPANAGNGLDPRRSGNTLEEEM